MYYPYYLRCLASRRDELIALGVRLGVLQQDADTGAVHATDAGCWSEIGIQLERAGGSDDAPEYAPVTDPDSGEPYWLANLLTPVDLRERAQSLAATDPAIAAALANLSDFFIVDDQGNATAPATPVQVFWSTT